MTIAVIMNYLLCHEVEYKYWKNLFFGTFDAHWKPPQKKFLPSPFFLTSFLSFFLPSFHPCGNSPTFYSTQNKSNYSNHGHMFESRMCLTWHQSMQLSFSIDTGLSDSRAKNNKMKRGQQQKSMMIQNNNDIEQNLVLSSTSLGNKRVIEKRNNGLFKYLFMGQSSCTSLLFVSGCRCSSILWSFGRRIVHYKDYLVCQQRLDLVMKLVMAGWSYPVPLMSPTLPEWSASRWLHHDYSRPFSATSNSFVELLWS